MFPNDKKTNNCEKKPDYGLIDQSKFYKRQGKVETSCLKGGPSFGHCFWEASTSWFQRLRQKYQRDLEPFGPVQRPKEASFDEPPSLEECGRVWQTARSVWPSRQQ
jgi:hypothetical protein